MVQLSPPPLLKERLFALFSFRWLGRSTGGVSGDVSACDCCSGGVLLCNRKPCAYSQKANKFPFRLSTQCLQLRCPPPLQYPHFGLLSTAAVVRLSVVVICQQFPSSPFSPLSYLLSSLSSLLSLLSALLSLLSAL